LYRMGYFRVTFDSNNRVFFGQLWLIVDSLKRLFNRRLSDADDDVVNDFEDGDEADADAQAEDTANLANGVDKIKASNYYYLNWRSFERQKTEYQVTERQRLGVINGPKSKTQCNYYKGMA